MSQPDINPNGRNSVNGYPEIQDLRRPSVERKSRNPSRANSVSYNKFFRQNLRYIEV